MTHFLVEGKRTTRYTNEVVKQYYFQKKRAQIRNPLTCGHGNVDNVNNKLIFNCCIKLAENSLPLSPYQTGFRYNAKYCHKLRGIVAS